MPGCQHYHYENKFNNYICIYRIPLHKFYSNLILMIWKGLLVFCLEGGMLFRRGSVKKKKKSYTQSLLDVSPKNSLSLFYFWGEVASETPKNKLGKFTGVFLWEVSEYSLNNEHMLLQGYVLRNSGVLGWCFLRVEGNTPIPPNPLWFIINISTPYICTFCIFYDCLTAVCYQFCASEQRITGISSAGT